MLSLLAEESSEDRQVLVLRMQEVRVEATSLSPGVRVPGSPQSLESHLGRLLL